MPKENSDNKLYMLTDENNPSIQNINKKRKTNSKNFLVNSESSNKRNGISLPKGVNRDKKYNLAKLFKKVIKKKLKK
jgi:hypothetical protein